MKEYIQCLHAIWDVFQNNTEPNFVGQYYRFQLMPSGYNPGPIQFPRPKVFLGAISNAMARVAGEVADGVLPGGFMTEKYVREVYLPMVKVGLDKAGRTWKDIEIHGGPVAVFDESESEIEGAAQERAARLITNAFSVNPYFVRIRDSLFELHGWRDLAERLHALAREGKSHEEMQRILPEEVLRAFVPPSSTLDGLPENLRTRFEYARRIEFNMVGRTSAERDRLRHILKLVQATETPGVPVGLG
jgi:alkanesulfonate monooxygenase SsuD/methylene tetrahydromethanopterin reductase-like flavin-dependent oxidoreductase (luciferase family)